MIIHIQFVGLNTCDKVGQKGMGDETTCQDNKWAAAKKACEDAGYELPRSGSRGLPATEMYCRAKGISFYTGYNNNSGWYTRDCNISTKDIHLATKIEEKSDINGYFWSDNCNTINCSSMRYKNGYGMWAAVNNSVRKVICVGKN